MNIQTKCRIQRMNIALKEMLDNLRALKSVTYEISFKTEDSLNEIARLVNQSKLDLSVIVKEVNGK